MKVGFTNSLFSGNKILALYAATMTAVAGGILLLPAQTPTPNVSYDLFKIGQTTANPAQLATGWKPVGYACQAANPEQIAQGSGPTVCGYKYTTASHNLITQAGIDWLKCLMNRGTNTCDMTNVDKWIAVANPASCPPTPLIGDTTLASEVTTNGLARAAGTFTPNNGTASYTEVKLFTASGTLNNICASGLFTQSSAGTMVFENTFSTTNVINLDTLQVTWTVTL